MIKVKSHSLSGSVTSLLPFLLMLMLGDYGACHICPESSCGEHGPVVRFPFWIRGRQPEHCGYPGFELSCSAANHTVLHLSNSVKLIVRSIDYIDQVINTSDPQGCLPRLRLDFDHSVSPFQPYVEPYNFSLFNCSSQRTTWDSIDCLSTPTHRVYNVFADASIYDSEFELQSCTKMYDLRAVSYEIFLGNSLFLIWNNPNCGDCEAIGRRCMYWNESLNQLETECSETRVAAATPSYFPVPSEKPRIADTSKKLMIVGITIGFTLLVMGIIRLYIKNSFDKIEKEYRARIERFLDDYRSMKPTRYSHADLKRITEQFKHKLGQGTYGTVFKGKLSNEILVAVKVLNDSKGNGEEFVNEVGMMGRIHHVNVVRLVGFCADGYRRALVYEYLPNDSLQKFISSADTQTQFLGWENLHRIALGISKGLEYLHQGCDQRILHFDIKPQNILLDNDFNPKISDFGLAKLWSKDKSAVSMTTARGTIGYIAPEVFSRNFGNVSYKSDVYSFGMLVLEMVGGRKNVDETPGNGEQIYFPEWIYNLLDEGEDLRVHIEEEEEEAKTAKKLAIVGLWCIQWNPADRPPMKTVVQMLEGGGKILTMPSNPFGASDADTSSLCF